MSAKLPANMFYCLFIFVSAVSMDPCWGDVCSLRQMTEDLTLRFTIINSNAHVCSTEMDYTEHWRHRMMHRKNTQIRWMTWRKEIQIGVYACWNVLRVWCRHMLIYIYIIIQYIINIIMHDIDIMVTSKIKWVINY